MAEPAFPFLLHARALLGASLIIVPRFFLGCSFADSMGGTACAWPRATAITMASRGCGGGAWPGGRGTIGHNSHYHSEALLARRERPRGAGAVKRAAKKAVAGVRGARSGEAATARRPRPRAPRPRASAITLTTRGCGGGAWPGGRGTLLNFWWSVVLFGGGHYLAHP